MIDPTEKDIRRRVIYARLDPHRTTEMGIYSSRNARYCFVRYGTETNGSPTEPGDLEWYDDVPKGTSFYDRTTDPPCWRIKGDSSSDIYTKETEK